MNRNEGEIEGEGRPGRVARSTTVVIATRDRRAELERTLHALTADADPPRVVVVDNASTDGTTAFVRTRFPGVRAVRLPRNRGAAARNVGAALAGTPYIAFSDDDSWWEPGSLSRAADLLDADPALGLVAASVLVGDERRPDPVNAELDKGVPGGGPPGVLGFLGCAAVVRARAFVQAGGYSPLLFFVGEEALLAQDLAAAGWDLRHDPRVRAVHAPSPHRPAPQGRDRMEMRNRVLAAWMRRPASKAAAATCGLARAARERPAARAALGDALRALPSALARRRRLPAHVERAVSALERA